MSDREQTDRRKSAKNYHVFIPLQKMLSLLVSAHFSIVSPSVRTEKVPRFDLQYIHPILFCVIREIYVALIDEFGRPPGNRK